MVGFTARTADKDSTDISACRVEAEASFLSAYNHSPSISRPGEWLEGVYFYFALFILCHKRNEKAALLDIIYKILA